MKMDDNTETPDATEAMVVELRTRTEELQRKLQDLQQISRGRLVHSAMKVEAVRAGMIDLDGLKLLDLTSMQLTDEGEVEGASEAMSSFKRAKPWLFGATSSSSSASAPKAQPPRQKHASEMTEAEYRSARAALIKQHF
jgi:hypothetical protein